MVKPTEFLALDPEVEDILSMWGKDINSQNVDYYFGSVDIPCLESASQLETTHHFGHDKVSDREFQFEGLASDPPQPATEPARCGIIAASKSQEPKGFLPKPRFPNPKGLEEISQLGSSAEAELPRSIGAPGSLTRVSLPRDPQGLPGIQPSTQGTSAADGSTENGGQGADPLLEENVNLDHSGIRPEGENSRLRSANRKQKRPIGSQVISENLVLGMEVSMREALAMADCTLVGRARGKPISSAFLQEWGANSFTFERIVNFEAQTLAKGWFKFKFEDRESADWVLQQIWHIDNIPVLFKKWSPLFDAIKESTDTFPVWVRAPGLPSLLWTEEVFRTIGNRLGVYMTADMSFLTTNNLATARILVMLRPSGGLAQKINLQFDEYVHEQLLDYEYLPFRCHWCHEHGHLAKDCPHKRRRRHFRRNPAHRTTVQSVDQTRMEPDMPENQEHMNMEAEETENDPTYTSTQATDLEAENDTDQVTVEETAVETVKIPEAEIGLTEETPQLQSVDPEKGKETKKPISYLRQVYYRIRTAGR